MAEGALTKAEVEKIVHDYIMNNGQVILDSVEQFQRKSMEAKQADGLARHRDTLFKDEKSPFIGNEKGDVVVIEFFDYNCGYCKRVLPQVQSITEKDKNVKVVFREFPILGPTSETASKWALAAHKQGKYFEFHRGMMEHKGAINQEALDAVAKAAGLDLAKAKTDAESSDVIILIEKNRLLASEMGITGTPAFIIGDEVVPGALGEEELLAKIEAARKKAAKKE